MDFFKDDYKKVANRAFKSNVKLIITIGTNYQDSKRGVEIAEEIDFVYTSIGWHPHDTKFIKNLDNLLKIEKLAKSKKVIAYGEIGLDYFKNYSPKDIQKKYFRYQINIAKELKLPIIIHDREAHNDIIEILHQENAYVVGGVIHCFSGDRNQRQRKCGAHAQCFVGNGRRKDGAFHITTPGKSPGAYPGGRTTPCPRYFPGTMGYA